MIAQDLDRIFCVCRDAKDVRWHQRADLTNALFGQSTHLISIWLNLYQWAKSTAVIKLASAHGLRKQDYRMLKSQHFQPFLALLRDPSRTHEWVEDSNFGRVDPISAHAVAEEQLYCSEMTGLRSLSERCCGDVKRLRRASGSCPAG
jgi:hypothetical protein